MAKKQDIPLAFTLQVRQPTQISQIVIPQFSATGTSKTAQTIQTSQARAAAGILGTKGGVNLGPMGYMSNELVIAIELFYPNFLQYQAFAKYMNHNLQESDLLHTIQTYLYEPLRQSIFHDINTLAPRDSGRLRNAMELSVAGGKGGQGGSHSSTSSLNPFYVVLNTGRVEYAQVVNNMPKEWLQHWGMQHRGRTRISERVGRTVKPSPHTLYDPQAVQNWYEFILDNGRNRAAQLWYNLDANTGPLANLVQPIIDYYKSTNRPNAIPNNQLVPVYFTPQQIIESLFTVRFG